MSDKKVIDLNKFRNKKLAKKIFVFLRIPIVILVVVAALFLSARLLGNVAVSNVTDALRQTGEIFRKGGEYPYSTDVSKFRKAASIGSSPLIIYDDSSLVLSSSANEIFTMPLSYADSKVITKNGRALVYSNSSNDIILQSKTERLGSISEEGAVVAATLAKNGYFATSYAAEENQSVLTVYNNRFEKVFQWNCSQERISDISLSSNGKRLAVAAVGAENAEIYTRILVFDIKSSEPLADCKYSGTLFLRIVYTNSNKVIAAGDNRTVVITSKGEPVDELVYSEDSILAFCADDNGNTAVFYEEFGGAKTGMVRFSSSGKKTCAETLDGNPDCVTAYGGKIAAANGNVITVYSSSGKVTRTVETENSVSQIFCCSGEIYTIENSSICKY
ncbi:MAG: hypothetical protein IJE72_05415 [Clostridia bacterium]|nr:hypothetical protein [Clostridia bacterium]MBQ4603265.1 hypothetical protein [Clostridia bacterium]